MVSSRSARFNVDNSALFPHCISKVLRMVSTINYCFIIQQSLIGLYNKGTPCSLWGTNWIYTYIFFLWRYGPTRNMASSFFRFLDPTQRRNTDGRTPLDEWAGRRRDLQLTTHNTHKRQTLMPSAGFETAIPTSERPQTYATDRAATGTSEYLCIMEMNFSL
jgi:hypothetical protein